MTRDILLVHGAFHNGTCWNDFMPDLRVAGWNPLALTLPGHEPNARNRWKASMRGYAAAVVRAARSMPSGRPLLVGHSMGGQIASAAAELDSSAFSGIVFISAAIASRAGSNLIRMPVTTAMNAAVSINLFRGYVRVAPEKAAEVFYNTCEPEVVASAVAQLVPQPIRPGAFSKVTATAAGLGSLPLYYVECLRDRALDLNGQRSFQNNADIKRVVSIDSDHSPFLSARAELVRAFETLVG